MAVVATFKEENMPDMNLVDVGTRLAALESHMSQRFSSVERLQYWTLGLLGGLVLALLTGSFAIIATLLR